MAFSIKVERTETLCERCGHGTVARNGDDRVIVSSCGAHGSSVHVSEPVKTCSYFDFRWKYAYEMRDKAWVLETRKGQIIGFIAPEKQKDRD